MSVTGFYYECPRCQRVHDLDINALLASDDWGFPNRECEECGEQGCNACIPTGVWECSECKPRVDVDAGTCQPGCLACLNDWSHG